MGTQSRKAQGNLKFARKPHTPQGRKRGVLRSLLLALCSAVLVVLAFGSMYNRRLTAESTGTELYVIGAELVDLGAYADAIEVLQKAARMNSEDARVFFELGNAAHFAGDDGTAAKAWHEAVRLDPTFRGKAPYAAPLGRPASRSAAQEKLVGEANKLWHREWRIFGPPSAEAEAARRAGTDGRAKQNASLPYP